MVWLFALALLAQTPSVDELLARAGAYVARFEQEFPNIVAEERYVQVAPDPLPGTASYVPTGAFKKRRELVSDFLLVKVPGADTWLPFRDVFEVDGKPVRDRQDRLTRLFLQPPPAAIDQAERIVADSSRYNLAIVRTINVPTLALLVISPPRQAGFRFSRPKLDASLGADVWSVDYEETARPTLIKGSRNLDLPAHGRIWIEAANGRILRTELHVSDGSIATSIVTDYQRDPASMLAIPAKMQETYELKRYRTQSGYLQVTGTATYSKFRRFNVHVDERVGPQAPELVEIPAGRFTMGSPVDERGRNADEVAHEVTISRPFFLGRYEVTQAEWTAVMGNNPSRFADCGPRCPVENVTFDDAHRYIGRLNAQPGAAFVYRLPTEAEWEYACRAGTTTPFATGATITTAQANVDGRFPYADTAAGELRERPTPVGTFAPNAFGLADMHGNVWEWTSDWYGPYGAAAARDPRGLLSGEKRVIRGGSWFFDANSARCALRYTHAPVDRGFSLGFRVAADRR